MPTDCEHRHSINKQIGRMVHPRLFGAYNAYPEGLYTGYVPTVQLCQAVVGDTQYFLWSWVIKLREWREKAAQTLIQYGAYINCRYILCTLQSHNYAPSLWCSELVQYRPTSFVNLSIESGSSDKAVRLSLSHRRLVISAVLSCNWPS